MTEDRIKDSDPIVINEVDRVLNSLGQFYRHNAMHAAAIRMVYDEFGRCARCVKLGFWKSDA